MCQGCNSELIARCGEKKTHHWAHKGNRTCDHWWENETEWHRSWKNHFPSDWQEIVHHAENGEKHIADLKTPENWILELQHSYLKPDERRSRNDFYKRIIWIVNGQRRKRDWPQFDAVLKESRLIARQPVVYRVLFPDESRLLEEWRDPNALVFLDFQEALPPDDSRLWLLFPMTYLGEVYLIPFSKRHLINFHLQGEFDQVAKNLLSIAQNIKKHQKRVLTRSNRLPGIHRTMSRRSRRF